MASATFWDNIALRYAAKPINDMAAYEATLERTRSFLHKDDRVLEIGCGTGGTALQLAPFVGSMTATDISSRMIDIATERRASESVNNLQYLQMPATEAAADAPFDAICAFSILHLLDDLPQTLAHLRTQLRPGGFIISKTACLGDMNPMMGVMIKLLRMFGKAPYVNAVTADALEQSFIDTGFEIIETGYFGTNETARFIVARRP